jgi:hypothetical protein
MRTTTVRTFRNTFWCCYVVLFVLAFLLVRHLEGAGVFDSVGLWHSLYYAAGIALPTAVILALFGKSILSRMVPRR